MKKVFVLLISLISFGTVLAETTIKATSFKGGVFNKETDEFVSRPDYIGVDVKMVGNCIYIYSSKTQIYKLVELLNTDTADDGRKMHAFRALALHLNGEEGIVNILLDDSGMLGIFILLEEIHCCYMSKVYEVTE